jgi:hypothetical protein
MVGAAAAADDVQVAQRATKIAILAGEFLRIARIE